MMHVMFSGIFQFLPFFHLYFRGLFSKYMFYDLRIEDDAIQLQLK